MCPRRSIPQHKKQGISPVLIVVGSILIVLGVVSVDFLTKIQSPATPPSVSGLSTNSRTAGNLQATISFTEFSDFQ